VTGFNTKLHNFTKISHSALDDLMWFTSECLQSFCVTRPKRSPVITFGWIFIEPLTEVGQNFRELFTESWDTILTQLTAGGSSEADMATPIRGPALPWSKANATPVPDGRAHKTPIHSDREFPLKIPYYAIWDSDSNISFHKMFMEIMVLFWGYVIQLHYATK